MMVGMHVALTVLVFVVVPGTSLVTVYVPGLGIAMQHRPATWALTLPPNPLPAFARETVGTPVYPEPPSVSWTFWICPETTSKVPVAVDVGLPPLKIRAYPVPLV